VNRQLKEWKTTFYDHLSDKSSTWRLFKELPQLNNEKTNNLMLRRMKEVSRRFSREDIRMTNECMKSCSASSGTRKMQKKNKTHNEIAYTY
jgi:hypothetical protein